MGYRCSIIVQQNIIIAHSIVARVALSRGDAVIINRLQYRLVTSVLHTHIFLVIS